MYVCQYHRNINRKKRMKRPKQNVEQPQQRKKAKKAGVVRIPFLLLSLLLCSVSLAVHIYNTLLCCVSTYIYAYIYTYIQTEAAASSTLNPHVIPVSPAYQAAPDPYAIDVVGKSGHIYRRGSRELQRAPTVKGMYVCM